jgi:signal transduction histidine kinase
VVADDGVGVPDPDEDTIFTAGVTGAGSKGSGLGMHIAKRIAESGDGDIVVADSPLGDVRFAVRLPAADR